jgi:alcohol dehydrogenase
LTTICGTDVHILRGAYPVEPGLTLGHEPVGVIYEIGLGVTGYQIGDRVLVGPILSCGSCGNCPFCDGKPFGGGWRFGTSIDGCHAEYLLVPFAMANLALIPDDVTDEQVGKLASLL